MLPRLYMYIAYTARLRKQQQQQKPNVFARAVAPPGSGFRRSQHPENTTTGHLTYTSLRGNLSGDQRHTLRQFIAAADASRARWHANRQQTRQLILKGAEMSWGIGTTRSIALKPKSRSRSPHYKMSPCSERRAEGVGECSGASCPPSSAPNSKARFDCGSNVCAVPEPSKNEADDAFDISQRSSRRHVEISKKSHRSA